MRLLTKNRKALSLPGGLTAAGVLFLAAMISVLVVPSSEAKEYDESGFIEKSQNVLGRPIGNHVFVDDTGKTVKIRDLTDKPLIVSMVYSACTTACPLITDTLIEAIDIAKDAVGENGFRVVTIGFDVINDSPERMRSFAQRNGIPLSDGWRVLSGSQDSIDGLASDIGFAFMSSVRGFDHLNQTTIVAAGGNIYRQVYGQTFESLYLVEPLKNLVFGTDAPFSSFQDLVNKIRLFCTIYNPKTDRYQFDLSLFFRMGIGFIIISFLSVIVFRGWARILRGGPGTA